VVTPAESDILATLIDGAEWDVATLADDVGVCVKTVMRALPGLESAGLVSVTRGGGRGIKTTVTILDKSTNSRELSGFRRVYEDPADKRPGEEYTPLVDVDAARADRARLMADKSWRPRPTWAKGV
jgi:DNA-binding GntR family transcriptional regulator